VGVGGEWGDSVLLAMEWAKGNHNRGLIASIPQLGGPGGLLLANVAVLAFSASMSTEEFLAWGWRVPFFFSIVMVAIGLWIRPTSRRRSSGLMRWPSVFNAWR
jgi:MFS family permease